MKKKSVKRIRDNNKRFIDSCSFYSLHKVNPDAVDEGLGKCNKSGMLSGCMGIKTECTIRREL